MSLGAQAGQRFSVRDLAIRYNDKPVVVGGKKYGKGYVITDGRYGVILEGVFREEHMAKARRDRMAGKAAMETINCISCKNPFKSWDKVKNKMCKKCIRNDGPSWIWAR